MENWEAELRSSQKFPTSTCSSTLALTQISPKSSIWYQSRPIRRDFSAISPSTVLCRRDLLVEKCDLLYRPPSLRRRRPRAYRTPPLHRRRRELPYRVTPLRRRPRAATQSGVEAAASCDGGSRAALGSSSSVQLHLPLAVPVLPVQADVVSCKDLASKFVC
jgi:hypothetical protein